ncbi:hypothetical protein PENNAL_c0027G08329 [Penicillium nalgiovense]|uniref:Uncharacterized protein n=1 Tax=Penicillium nalgiovense TaxID=60175 RepID=A0A1V6Y9X4_PENNA|nr:hypothetical protein PENNAL_c0027G08329 [Penicillium nalgiovense]
MENIQVDVLVCGGGMSGMACAAFAAEAGAKVLVAEKQADVGGSSNYSAGMFASTLSDLVDILQGWGVDNVQARRTIENYDRVVRLGDKSISLEAPIGRAGSPPTPLVDGEGPFYAMEVQPSITFTYGGIAIDAKGHALTPDKSKIPGLLVAGVDAGGFSNLGYAGGLALAFVTGLWAAREVARDLGLPEPRLPLPDVRDGEDKPVQGRL